MKNFLKVVLNMTNGMSFIVSVLLIKNYLLTQEVSVLGSWTTATVLMFVFGLTCMVRILFEDLTD